MKNQLIYNLESKVKIKVSGKNIERFIKKIIQNKIDLLRVSYPKRNEAIILIYQKDYEKLDKIKTIYELNNIDVYGKIKIKKILKNNLVLISAIIFSLILLVFISNVIFKIDIIHNSKEVRDFLKNELTEYGLKEYKFKKNYNEIAEIKKQILDKYKDKIEWLEIENVGTKYIVRVEMRIIKQPEGEYKKQHIVAKKSAIIKKIEAKSGEILRNVDNYVNKGDIIISGNLKLYDSIKDTIKAEGSVFGEVWYETTVEYPFIYSEIKETGNTKNNLALKIFNNYFELGFKKYKEKIVENEIIFQNSILPFSLVKQHQKETKTISLILTEEEAIKAALEKSLEKIKLNLKENEEVLDYKIIKANIKEDKVVLHVFFSVLENITDYMEINEVE